MTYRPPLRLEETMMKHDERDSYLHAPQHWHMEDLDFSSIDTDHLREREDVFLLVCCASFVESGAETYSRTLIEYFFDDVEISTWLREHWEVEELRHGRALEAYIRHAWPEFDWDGAYADFFAEYEKLCIADELEPTRGQELVARCIVEMGTTTYYQALNAVCDEPVLRDLTQRIRTDEVRHYKHFYHHFRKYRQLEGLHRGQVIAALWRRATELQRSDTDIALRHAMAWRFRGDATARSAEAVKKKMYGLMRSQYPIELATRMALKPLELSPRLQRWLERPGTALARWILLS